MILCFYGFFRVRSLPLNQLHVLVCDIGVRVACEQRLYWSHERRDEGAPCEEAGNGGFRGAQGTGGGPDRGFGRT